MNSFKPGKPDHFVRKHRADNNELIMIKKPTIDVDRHIHRKQPAIAIPMTAKMMWNASDIPICERAKKKSFKIPPPSIRKPKTKSADYSDYAD